MAILSTNRYQGGSSSAYSALMRQPNGQEAGMGRTILTLALVFLCPPVGLTYMWRQGVFRRRGRVVLTLLAGIELLLFFVWTMPRREVQTIQPTPGSPQRVTAVSEEEAVTALSNMDELLGLVDLSIDENLLDDAGDAGEANLFNADEAQQNAEMAASAEDVILNTTVYAVYSGAKFYHVSGECRGQINRRELTIREALNDGLRPCSRCNPPSL